MSMVAQQRPSVAGCETFHQNAPKPIEERIPVLMVPKNLRPFDPSDHDMVERPRSVYSWLTWHLSLMRKRVEYINISWVCPLLHKTLRDEVNWRLPVFDCSRHLIPLDGAALLLNELWQRKLAGDGERNVKECLPQCSRWSPRWKVMWRDWPRSKAKRDRWLLNEFFGGINRCERNELSCFCWKNREDHFHDPWPEGHVRGC